MTRLRLLYILFIFQLIDQLSPGGRLIIPVGPLEGWSVLEGAQYLEQIDKLENGQIKRKRLINVRYVPLMDKESQEKLE